MLGPQNVPRGASLSAIQSAGSWQRARGDLIFLSVALKLLVWVWLWNARTYASIRHSTYGWRFHTQSLPHGTRGVWRTSWQCKVYQTLPPSCERAGTQTSPLSGLIFCTDCCPLAWGHAGCPLSGVERYLLLRGSKCTISIGRAIREHGIFPLYRGCPLLRVSY